MLLTGPCGCGKTATLKVLCRDLDIEVLEFEPAREFETSNDAEEVWEESEVKIFRRFLRLAEYFPIDGASVTQRLVLIEQVPNIFYRLVFFAIYDFFCLLRNGEGRKFRDQTQKNSGT